MNTTLGKRIAVLRHEKKMKQDELAERLGVSPQAVSKWENDQTCPDISALPLLAEALDISVDELLTGKKKNAPETRVLSEDERRDIKDMMLRIVITSGRGDAVRVNLPLSLVEAALDSGLNMAQISGNEALKSIDLNKIMDLVRQGAVGNLVEIESTDGHTVKIFVE